MVRVRFWAGISRWRGVRGQFGSLLVCSRFSWSPITASWEPMTLAAESLILEQEPTFVFVSCTDSSTEASFKEFVAG